MALLQPGSTASAVDMALNIASIRDTKWLTLEVCRQFQRGTCSRSDEECKFAHPPKSCQVENGRVIACFDSLKVRTAVFCSWRLEFELLDLLSVNPRHTEVITVSLYLPCDIKHICVLGLHLCRSSIIPDTKCYSFVLSNGQRVVGCALSASCHVLTLCCC